LSLPAFVAYSLLSRKLRTASGSPILSRGLHPLSVLVPYPEHCGHSFPQWLPFACFVVVPVEPQSSFSFVLAPRSEQAGRRITKLESQKVSQDPLRTSHFASLAACKKESARLALCTSAREFRRTRSCPLLNTPAAHKRERYSSLTSAKASRS
jgi:hypothetical protein